MQLLKSSTCFTQSCCFFLLFFKQTAKKKKNKCYHIISPSAPEPSLQHHEGEEPWHGGRREEEVCDEASSGGPSGNQENLLCQLHRHLQTVSLTSLSVFANGFGSAWYSYYALSTNWPLVQFITGCIVSLNISSLFCWLSWERGMFLYLQRCPLRIYDGMKGHFFVHF